MLTTASQSHLFLESLDLQAALKKATKSTLGHSIGECKTKLRDLRLNVEIYGSCGSDDESDEDESKPVPVINQSLLEGLAPLYKRLSTTKESGSLESVKLRIIRTGCAFDGQITHDETHSETDDRLKEWFEHASVSGYGDVLTQETKFDEDVRNAREISASEFSSKKIFSSRSILVGRSLFTLAMFESNLTKSIYTDLEAISAHIVIPSTNLVGTFLLGLGDSTHGRYLNVHGMKLSAEGGAWCAFFPDVVCSVERIPQGNRAVIAFKIPRTTDDSQSLCDIPDEYHSQIDKVFDPLELPIGILLDRNYCMGTTELSGLDA
ncbi:hypothetical protein JAAARDRAFT_195394 [Jaapia argillacea MUCL 33604]|uniref:Uncharacterized protein n=1 Tax=Jaapia argillacea MUCL 33604 TaxID=933084 RepID=A0A067PW91_9AGAM|nr:hypothetical protein JAAARDRAFT_195394 [Jaapia argillacea MUCL 33604]